jgi:hypothetical protein
VGVRIWKTSLFLENFNSKIKFIGKMSNNNNGRNGNGLRTRTRVLPVVRTTEVLSQAPQFKTVGSRTTVINHEEIATVSGTSSFGVTDFHINPGLPIFRWLSAFANRFDLYCWKKLQFVYIPAEAVTTTAGSVHMAWDYDPDDAAPADLAEMSSFETIKTSRFYETSRLNINVNLMKAGVQMKRVRAGPVGGDLVLYDGGNLLFATISGSALGPIGQLWVWYEIELVSPSLPLKGGNHSPHSHSVFTENFDHSYQTGIPLAIRTQTTILDGLHIAHPQSTGNYEMDPGVYDITGDVTFSSSMAGGLTADYELHIDGAPVNPIQVVQYRANSLPTDLHEISFSFCALVEKAGTIVSVIQTLVGNGDLKTIANAVRLFFTAIA